MSYYIFMEVFHGVGRLEVKRCFVISDKMRPEKKEKISFEKRIGLVKEKVMNLSEKELDEYILKDDPGRLTVYNKMHWYTANMEPNEIGVWEKAGDLPIKWTRTDLGTTASYVFGSMKKKTGRLSRRRRAISVIEGVLKNVDLIEKESFLRPIVIPRGIRVGVNKERWGIDDGNMRCIALAGIGRKEIKVYLGMRFTDLLIYRIRKFFEREI